MDKKTLTRAGIIAGLLISIILLAWGCSVQQANKIKTPELSDPDGVFTTINGLEITNQMVWDEIKATDAYNYLESYVDRMTYESYIASVTDEEIAEEIKQLTYNTKDDEVIAEIQALPELDAQYVNIYEARLKGSGFDPAVDADVRAYFEEGIAKYKYVADYLKNPGDSTEEIFSETEMLAWYGSNVFEDVCAVTVRFHSEQEAINILTSMDIILDFEGTFARYLPGNLADAADDTDFISATTAEDGEVPNVEELTEEEVFTLFIELANYTSPWKDQIAEDIEAVEYCTDYADVATFNYEEMTEGRTFGQTPFDLAQYLFTTLDLSDADKPNFSSEVIAFGGDEKDYMFVFKANQNEVPSWNDLSQAEKDAVLVDMVDSGISASKVNQVIAAKRVAEIEVLDPDVALKTELQNGVVFDNNGSEKYFAYYGDTKITADEIFDYAVSNSGLYYALDIAKRDAVVNSDLFTEFYGENRNYLESTNEKIEGFNNFLQNQKLQYNAGYFAANGIDPSEVSWSEFLYAAYGAPTTSGVITRNFVYPNLILPYVEENVLKYEMIEDYMQDQFDNYFSIDTEHILLFVDFDEDYTLDDFSDFQESLDAAGLTEYNQLKQQFEEVLEEKINDEMTFEEIVEEYNDSLISDENNPWRNLKAYGFRIKTELVPEINYNTSTNLDDAYLNTAMNLINEYKISGNEELEEIVSQVLTISDFGIHKIKATKGDAFEAPSAAFSETDSENPVYTEGSENDSDIPSKTQFELYVEMKLLELQPVEDAAEIVLPDTVVSALDYYYGELFTKLTQIQQYTYASSGFNIGFIEFLLANDAVSFEVDNATYVRELELVLEATYYSLNVDGLTPLSEIE